MSITLEQIKVGAVFQAPGYYVPGYIRNEIIKVHKVHRSGNAIICNTWSDPIAYLQNKRATWNGVSIDLNLEHLNVFKQQNNNRVIM